MLKTENTRNAILLALLILIEAAKLCALLCARRTESREAVGPCGAEAKADTAQPEENGAEAAGRPAPGSIDEGIENIMTYRAGNRRGEEGAAL